MNRPTVREIALNVLLKIENNRSYSNLLVTDVIERNKLHRKDAALLTEVVYGTVQRKKTLDYYLAPYLPKKIKQSDQWMIPLLRMSLYQMIYLDRVPDHAVIHEAVQIGKKRGHRGLAGMINGILRNIQRNGVRNVDLIVNDAERIAIKYSHPDWLVRRWMNQYGMETTEKICAENVKAPLLTARVNTIRTTVGQVIDRLREDKVTAARGKLSPEAIEIKRGNLVKSSVFTEGLVTIQDESSMLVARALDPQKNERILDCCAGPGGKTTHLAERMDNSGKIVALDLYEHKVKLIDSQVRRLRLTNVETDVLDSRKAAERYREESFDRILVDAPCSGFGVIRRKPDIKWSKREEEIEQIAALQMQILNSVAPLVKRGGTLVYSTCTIEREENERVVNEFLNVHPQFSFDLSLSDRLPKKLHPYMDGHDGYVKILPHYFGNDGFFIAAFTRHE